MLVSSVKRLQTSGFTLYVSLFNSTFTLPKNSKIKENGKKVFKKNMVSTKNQIIRTAFDLFSQYGIRSVSMEDIARNTGISKRTLYSFFEDKETLLINGIEYLEGELSHFLKQLEDSSYTAIDIILLFYEELLRSPRWYNRKFYEDLKKYPKAMQRKESEKAAFTKKCKELLDRGVKEDVFRKEINIEIIALLAKEQAKMLHPSKSFQKHSNTEVYETILAAVLRGISTDKGRLILEKWYKTKQIKNIVN